MKAGEKVEREELEELKEGDGKMTQNKNTKDCITLSGIYEVCIGRIYSFTIGRKSITGFVEEINPRFWKILVTTDRGKVYVDLRKVSVIEEVK